MKRFWLYDRVVGICKNLVKIYTADFKSEAINALDVSWNIWFER